MSRGLGDVYKRQVPNVGREMKMEYALSNSLGFGGHNACLAFKKWEG